MIWFPMNQARHWISARQKIENKVWLINRIYRSIGATRYYQVLKTVNHGQGEKEDRSFKSSTLLDQVATRMPNQAALSCLHSRGGELNSGFEFV